jgi:hypothetical protein
MTHKRWLAWVLAAGLVALLGTTALLGGACSGPSTARLILFSPSGEAGFLDDGEATSVGLFVTHSSEDLMSKVDDTTRAIVLTEATAGEVDPSWLR